MIIGPQEGTLAGTSDPIPNSTNLQRIAELARHAPNMVIKTLAHHIDDTFLAEAFRLTRKDGAPGIDGKTAKDFEADLRANLSDLRERFKSGTYRAPPVRRVHIPKGKGKTRPIGIPTFEDKVLQRAVAMVLNAVYEQDFLDCSYGFRPGRSAHQALEALWRGIMDMRGGGWVLEVDIKGFFDALDHSHLRSFLDLRVCDGVIRRTINKWLKAGILEEGKWYKATSGSPQGGVVSPILANVYLHEVLDKWFTQSVQPRMKGQSFLIRYADDATLVFSEESDARRVMDVLGKRLGKFGLEPHPEKTRLIRFLKPHQAKDPENGTFDLLGFTHYWGRSRRGKWVVKRKTAKSRFARGFSAIWSWCSRVRHWRIQDQWKALRRKLSGHFAYYGITHNYAALDRFRETVLRAWRYWLGRRSQKGYITWKRFAALQQRYPLPKARIVHSVLRNMAKL
ncbi:MAG: group II intron reverse transcriptase/maturase [Minwuia thermotolerans]|nr:MAG: group II intron reverse transcriptase/maturase [Minwuia thermotolerans]